MFLRKKKADKTVIPTHSSITTDSIFCLEGESLRNGSSGKINGSRNAERVALRLALKPGACFRFQLRSLREETHCRYCRRSIPTRIHTCTRHQPCVKLDERVDCFCQSDLILSRLPRSFDVDARQHGPSIRSNTARCESIFWVVGVSFKNSETQHLRLDVNPDPKCCTVVLASNVNAGSSFRRDTT